ncbi:DNA internalization-related competence protein ComEC/Rec2 [Solilutibacter silvestris]|uniref:DNA internalization-related competence protein ComEC/Rec2 n=1 Tax=Solilutibacter silvestris TaxID=1645665 RepID=A0A2K1PYG0_9GAMM|nr:DNA internalization-related competence protein ComEC/Rec2 [Lysobacter silvestris]PNS07813.1 DNA internalization-related competence protein ComEC/Rec2 [Lysobacter silvestris]
MHAATGTSPRIGPRRIGWEPAIGLLAGAMLCLWLPWLPPRWSLIALAVAGVVLWWKLPRRVWIATALLGFGWAGVIAGSALQARLPSELEGRELVVQGRVDNLPEEDSKSTRFQFVVDDDIAQQEELRGKRIRLGWFAAPDQTPPQIEAGSRWRLRVKLKRPHGLRNPGVQDSERGMLVDRIVATGSVKGGDGNEELLAGTGIDALRDGIAQRIEQGSSPARRFIRALSVGDTRGLSDDDWTILRANGLTHLIAISGSHVALTAILGSALAWLLWRAFPVLGGWMPRRTAMMLAGALVAAFYTALSGGEVPTLRTLLMMASVASAVLLRRRMGAVQALAIAAIALTLIDPLNLLRPGFWLSFSGVAWLSWCLREGGRGVLREFLGAQGVATLGLLPLSMLFFAQASWVSPLANLVAVPWWGFIVVPLSLLGVMLDGLHHGWGAPLWNLAAWLFDAAWPLFQRIAEWPFGQSRLPEASMWAWPLALLGAFWLLAPRKLPGKPLALALWLPMFTPLQPAPLPGEARMQMIDVGQGQAILVRTAHHAILYDAGPATDDGYDAGATVVLPALAALGVDRVDLMMLSHADADHAGGMNAVLAGMTVEAVQAPPGAPIEVDTHCKLGDHWNWDGVAFEVVSPLPESDYAGNPSSCVLRVGVGDHALLLTGDIDQATERALVERDPAALRADVVSMPHHGSAGSSSDAFVHATGATWAIASAGYRNKFHHPNPKALARWTGAGTRVLDTPHAGSVRVDLSAAAVIVATERTRRKRIWDSEH